MESKLVRQRAWKHAWLNARPDPVPGFEWTFTEIVLSDGRYSRCWFLTDVGEMYGIHFRPGKMIARADLVRDDGYTTIRSLWVTESRRGEGIGSAALKAVVSAFGTLGPIYLRVVPDNNSPLDARALVDWYSRYGFVTEDDLSNMYRNPPLMCRDVGPLNWVPAPHMGG